MSDTLAQEIAKPRKVALYMHLEWDDSFTVMDVRYVPHDENYRELPAGELREQPYHTYVRISEPVEIPSFQAVAKHDILRSAAACLDQQAREAQAQLEERLAAIRNRKQQFLALTYNPSEPPVAEIESHGQ